MNEWGTCWVMSGTGEQNNPGKWTSRQSVLWASNHPHAWGMTLRQHLALLAKYKNRLNAVVLRKEKKPVYKTLLACMHYYCLYSCWYFYSEVDVFPTDDCSPITCHYRWCIFRCVLIKHCFYQEEKNHIFIQLESWYQGPILQYFLSLLFLHFLSWATWGSV